MEKEKPIQIGRRYKRIEQYYTICSRNSLYSTIMMDLIMVVLPLLGIMYLIDLLKSNPGNIYISFVIVLSVMTILVNFVAHCFSIYVHRKEISWAENEMEKLNGVIKENECEHAREFVGLIEVLIYVSYGLFILSFLSFFVIACM